MATNLTADERETTVTATDGDDVVRIWTAQRRFIGRLRRHPKVTEVGTGHFGGSEWAEFTVPASEWNPVSGIKRAGRPMTEEQRAAAVARLHAARKEAGDE